MGFGKIVVSVIAAGFVACTGPFTAAAQSDDVSPTLLIETGPSDNPDYRRMVFVKYLSENGVIVAYKAYNRSEFIQIEDASPPTLVASCVKGQATTLADVRTYAESEAQADAASETPAITRFCIKDVPNWETGNRTLFLDPIFDGMPYAASRNN
jgi:hypothetical protein